MSSFRKFRAALSQGGLRQALKKTKDYLCFKRAINLRRKQLALYVANLYGWKVAFGPFVGMKISQSSWWGQTDLGGKILGFYELEVLKTLCKINKTKYKSFIDLGAADGYYAVGIVLSKMFDHSICFEMSKHGRQVIRQNAEINNVLNKISVYGFADENFDNLIPQLRLSEAVLLIDIEGAEFNLLSEKMLSKLRYSFLIVELHEFMIENGDVELKLLIDRLQKYFKIEWLTTGSRDLSQFEALQNFNDTDRWLMCSEGRMQLQKWIVCEPLGK